MKSFKNKTTDLEYRIVPGPELTEEEINGIAELMAKIIHQELISQSNENTQTQSD